MTVELKTPAEIEIMREAGRIVAQVHAAMRAAVAPGVSTLELDRIAAQMLEDVGATAAFLNYPKHDAPNFPATITASVNEELVHGIPSAERILQEGDVISLDVGCHYRGFVGDAAITVPVGRVSPGARRLISVAEKALEAAIAASVVGNETRDVAVAVQKYVEAQGYSVVKDYTGHGVGRAMHEEPAIPNWWVRKNQTSSFESVALVPGLVYAIEPMVIAGLPGTEELADGWTVVTLDGSLCVHVEHTVAITEDGPRILTLP